MNLVVWGGFIALILFLLFLDLGVFHRKNHVFSTREALWWTAFWISLGMLFNVFIFFAYEHHWLGIGHSVGHDVPGRKAALEYFAGYVLEKSLSVDNIFVMVLIFTYFRIPDKYQHEVLFWGIAGALVFRGIFIAAGITLLEMFEWVNYFFGALLIYSALRMLKHDEEAEDLENNAIIRWLRRVYPISPQLDGGKFFTVQNGVRMMTPLAVALIVIETTDVMFAIDSIPAVLAITTDPFIVFTSNVFAILGLRSLYFALAGMMRRFTYLQYGLVIILIFVGIKLIIAHWYKLPLEVSLGVIFTVLTGSVLLSLFKKSPEEGAAP